MFMHGNGEQAGTLALVGENIKRTFNDFKTATSPRRFPWPGFSARHLGSMQFGIFRILQAKVADKLIDFFNDVVYLSLKHGDTSKNEISIVGVF